jgi:hypothetical protein
VTKTSDNLRFSCALSRVHDFDYFLIGRIVQFLFVGIMHVLCERFTQVRILLALGLPESNSARLRIAFCAIRRWAV